LIEAVRLEIIDEHQKWFNYLETRNLISHTYNERLADKIYRHILKFPHQIDKLLKLLKK